MNNNKYMILYAFFYSALKETSPAYFSLFKDLLAELGIPEEGLRKVNIEDEALRNALKDIESSKKIRKALRQHEPSRPARENIWVISWRRKG